MVKSGQPFFHLRTFASTLVNSSTHTWRRLAVFHFDFLQLCHRFHGPGGRFRVLRGTHIGHLTLTQATQGRYMGQISGAFSRPGPPGPGSAWPCPDWTTRHGPRGTLAQLGPESDQARSAPPFHTPVVPRLL
jgi:hypothetical protein